VHLVGVTTEIYYDALPYERQIYRLSFGKWPGLNYSTT